jgi:hypothetical protein
MKIARRKCRTCGQKTASMKPGINHVGHFIVTILTGGLWLPFWMLAAIGGGGPWRCQQCGSRT